LQSGLVGCSADLTQYRRRTCVVASESFDDPKVAVMVIVVAIVDLIILIPLSRSLAKRDLAKSN